MNDLDRAREIIETLDTERQKMRLLDFPDQIREQKKKIRDLQQELKNVEMARALREADIANQIACETNSNTGKPAFPNAAARDNEKLKRLANDPEYQQLLKRVREASRVVEAAQDDLECIENKFKASRYVAALITEELSLYAGELSVHAMEGRAQMITGSGPLKKVQAF